MMQNLCRDLLHRQFAMPIRSCVCPTIARLNFYSTEKDEPMTEHFKWRKAWKDTEGFVPSRFAMWTVGKNTSKDFIRLMQTKVDFSWKGFIKWRGKTALKNAKLNQRYIPERHEILGPDLAAAHFIVFRGGSVRFHKGTKWVKKDEDDEYDLPDRKEAGLKVEAIDASGLDLLYEALANLVYMEKLIWLSFARNQNVDDWFLDKISGEFGNLEYLNISGCKMITHKGISVLHRLTKLKVLNVENLSDSVELRLALLSLQELKPDLEISGVDFDEPVLKLEAVQ